jgi:hypothetical protein
MVVVPPTFKLPLTYKLFELVDPDTFNIDDNVDASETNISEKLVFLNCVSDVQLKSFIDNNVVVGKG